MFSLEDLWKANNCPLPFEPGEELWNDPHISKMMLEAHLSPETDSASYKPEKIHAICEYLITAMQLSIGSSVVDLGCGPGLYSAMLSQKGYVPTGIDRSENSIAYANRHNPNQNATYLLSSYLEPFGTEQFDAALMISQDYGVLSPRNRKTLLSNIRNALKPGGYFAFDACTMAAYEARKNTAVQKWSSSEAGFWRPHQHIVLEKTIFYPDIPVICDFYAVYDSAAHFYHIYQSFFSPESIHSELQENGFQVKKTLSNLWGDAYSASSPAIGIIAQKI